MHGAYGVKSHRHVGLRKMNLAINRLRNKRISPKTYSSKTFYELNIDVKRRSD
jgi:hypothetical protein